MAGIVKNNPYKPNAPMPTKYVPPQVQGTKSGDPTSKNITKDSTGAWTESLDYSPSLEDNLATRDKFNAQAEARRQASLKALMGQYGGGGGGEAVGGGNIAFDEQGARNAAFARAKDQAGSVARSSMDSLREYLGSSGQLGGAKEMQGAQDVMADAAGSVGDYTRDQLMMDLDRAGQISDRNFSGAHRDKDRAAEKFRSLFSMFSEGKGPIY